MLIESNITQAGRETPRPFENQILQSFADLNGRVGIFGGTFDPVHRGHIAIASTAEAGCKLDSVVFIPAAQNPLKTSAPLAGDAARLAMIAEAIKGVDGLFVSPIQLGKTGPSYSVDLLREIHRQNPVLSLYFIIGADNVATLNSWKEIGEIATRAFIVVTRRGGRIPSTAHLDPAVVAKFIDLNLDVPISATEVRARTSRGESIDDLVVPPVAEFIRSRGLYR